MTKSPRKRAFSVIRDSFILKIKRWTIMIIVIILLFLFTVFAFYSTYISCLYALEILQCEPRDFPLCGFVITTISTMALLSVVTCKKCVILFLLFISLMIWISHLYYYFKNKKRYPFTGDFIFYFFLSLIIHCILFLLVFFN